MIINRVFPVVRATSAFMVVLFFGAQAGGQMLTLDEVVREVAAAEQARSQYRVIIEMPRRVGEIRENLSPFLITRYASTFWAYRTEKIQPTREPGVYFPETSTWNGVESRVLNGIAVPTDRPKFSIWTERPPGEYLDFVDADLGLRAAQLLMRPSELFIHRSSHTSVEERDLDGVRVIRVSVSNGDLIPNQRFVFDYDPSRDWLLDRESGEVLAREPGAENGSPTVVLAWEQRVTEARIVNGVWAPIELHGRTINQANQPDRRTVVETVTRIHEIEFPAEIDKSLFTIPIDTLPPNTEIADGRLGISYRLDDDVMIVDGQPYQLARAPGGEVTPQMLKSLLASATPLVDPNAPKSLANIRSRRGASAWWIGAALVVLGFGVAGWRFRLLSIARA